MMFASSGVYVGAVDDGDLLADLDQFHALGIFDDHLDNGIRVRALVDLVANDATARVDLLADLAVGRGSEDADLGSVLRHQSGKLAGVSKHNDQTDVLLVEDGRADSGGDRLSGRDGNGRVQLDVIEDKFVVDGALGLRADLRHDGDGVDG